MRRRSLPEINAGSMADIAFLLLVFFLVATTFTKEKGVPATLPPYYDGPPGTMNESYVLDIKVNKNDELLIEGKEARLENLKQEIKEFLVDPKKGEGFSSNAVLSLKNDIETSYKTYVQVYSIIRQAYKELRDNLAQTTFQKEYENLSISDKNIIIAQFPIKISEADPFIAAK